MANPGQAAVLDVAQFPSAQIFVKTCTAFFEEIKDLYGSCVLIIILISNCCSTPGRQLEERLNRDYGPGNAHYEALCSQIKQGLQDG